MGANGRISRNTHRDVDGMVDGMVETTVLFAQRSSYRGRMPLTPAERTLRARLAAYTLHSRRDARETTAPARAAFLRRFDAQVDPEASLPPKERARRAEAARRAHFARLALRSARVRRLRRSVSPSVDRETEASILAAPQNATAARPATDVRRLRSKEAADVRHQRPLSAA